MDNVLTVAFAAHNPEANHHRRYELTLGRDLLGDWTVVVRYGRVGHGGSERQYGGDPEAVRAIIRERLRRRLSAPRRIGCGYRLTELSVAPGVDPAVWLPIEVLAALR